MTTYVVSPLYNSAICRLCAVETTDSIYLFNSDHNLHLNINHYLPIQVEDDGKLPCHICQGCNIQLAATMSFLDLVVEGQRKLRDLWTQYRNLQKNLEQEQSIMSKALNTGQRIELVSSDNQPSDNILIKIIGQASLYGEDHEMTLRLGGLERPKKKRGRPRKVKDEAIADENLSTVEYLEIEPDPVKEDEEDDLGEDDGGRRLRRRRKPPQRFQETLAGKELERILREEGATDPDSDFEFRESLISDGFDQTNGGGLFAGEIIGHLTTPDGLITEPIIVPSPSRPGFRKKNKYKYTCDFCTQLFRDRSKWIRHRLSHKGLTFRCSQADCLEKFSSLAKVSIHHSNTSHSGVEIVRSDKPAEEEDKVFVECACGKTMTADSLSMHIEAEHENSKNEDNINFQSDKGMEIQFITNESRSDEETPKGNISLGADVSASSIQDPPFDIIQEGCGETKAATPPTGKFKCDECDRCFNHTSSLIYHKESVHNNGLRFKCSKCDKSFNHKQLLQRHQMVHSDSRPYACQMCGLAFKTKSNLVNHRIVHTGEKKFTCTQCGQNFAHKTSLKLHISWHQGVRPFECQFCKKSFTQKGNLRDHLRIHNGEKPFCCTFCGKNFTTSSQVKLHVKRHTGEKPWKCQYCDKEFLHRDTWKTHERRHTGEKPFTCPHCARAFAEHWSLKKHIRLHTGEKPYICNICGKKFADCSNMTKHKKAHLISVQGNMWDSQNTAGTPLDSEQILIYSLAALNKAQADAAAQQPISQVESTVEQMAFVDEEGNPIQIDLRDGVTAEILFLDVATNSVQVRTNEGTKYHIQLPQNKDIVGVDMIEQIRAALSAAKRNFDNLGGKVEADLNSVSLTEEAISPNMQMPLSGKNVMANSGVILLQEENLEMMRNTEHAHSAFAMRFTKSDELPDDFQVENLKEDFLNH